MTSHKSAAPAPATSSGQPGLLRAIGISHHYGGATALNAVSFESRQGEIHALVGENGAGKSTLVRVLSGALIPREGELQLDGVPLRLRSPRDARRHGIGVVHQDYHLFPQLSVAANLAILAGGESAVSRSMGERWLRRRAAALLSAREVDIDPGRLAATLSSGERKLVEIVGALASKPRHLILDEPTAALEPAERERLIALMQNLRDSGTALIFVSHRLDEVLRLADRATVFRNGKQVGVLQRDKDLGADELVMRILGYSPPQRLGVESANTSREVLRVSRPGTASGAAGIELTLHEGEVVGLAGLIGSGASELIRRLGGASSEHGGTIVLEGRTVKLASPREALSHGVAYVPEDRRTAGLFSHLSIADNLLMASLGRTAGSGRMDRRTARRRAQEACRALDVRCTSISQPVGSLSGGNQQKVLLGRYLLDPKKVLLIEEPTQGVDIGARAEIHHLLRENAMKGCSVLFYSSDLDEVLDLADRIVVFHAGKITAQFDNRIGRDTAAGSVSKEVIIAKAAGL